MNFGWKNVKKIVFYPVVILWYETNQAKCNFEEKKIS